MSSEWDQTCLAGITISFCSPDHQALVWKAHRPFCGPGKANPFTWPTLSQLEADRILEHMNDYAPSIAWGSPFRTVADRLLLWAHVQRDELPLLVQGLATPHPEGSNEYARQVVLGAVRAFETMRTAPPKGGSGMFRMPYLDPVTATAYHEFYNIDTRGSTREPWRTLYRHRLAVELFLLDMWDRSAGKDLPVEWFDRLFARDEDFVRVHIAPEYPATSTKLLSGEPASVILADRLVQYNS
ncbi:hypothetical protein JCM8208_002829 [Rhodotorula glutinis]